ncbi:MAG: endo-1,4-beta-xylanase, partial [Fusobacteriaceae bacterium]
MKKIISGLFLCSTILFGQNTLKDTYKDYFPIGAAFSYTNYKYYPDNIYNEFSSGVHENALKWESVQEEEGKFNFKRARSIVDYTKTKGITKFRGHTLMWHSQVPEW